MSHPLTTSSTYSVPPLIDDARRAATAINTFMATEQSDNPARDTIFHHQRVYRLELLNAQPDCAPENTCLWRASFRPQSGAAVADSMVFLVTPEGVARLTTGWLYFESDLYPGGAV